MARGFLSGVLWGGVVSVGVSGVASVLAPLPMAPEVGDAAPGVAVAPEQVTGNGTGEQGNGADTTLQIGQGAPQGAAPDPDNLTALDADTTVSAAVPQTGGADDLQTPSAVAGNSSADLQADDPVLPNPQALAPMEPQAADELSISTEPAQPLQPPADVVQGAFDAPAQPQVDDGTDSASALPATDDPDAPVASAVVPETAPQEDPISEPDVASAAPSDSVAPDTQTADAPLVVQDPDADTQTATGATRPAIGTPAVSLTQRDGGVTVNRLTGSASAQVALPIEAADGETTAGTGTPITKFAQDFEKPADKPLMSIVLIDTGDSPTSGSAGIAALRSFPYPISFAVDSSMADAAERMALYRKEGFEVLAMVNLPEGAAPSDAETAFGVTLAQLPEVVGVLEGTNGGLQGSREVADQVTAILAGSGHGLVTQDKGLNTMPKLARKEGVPADPIFRDFDSKGQTAQVIRRFLDQAAFKAGQEGAVIMLGRMRPDTISALLLWGLQDRAGQVALAPISAVLMREQ
ncbi:MAG: divergent polysaccharide deacetylase family protein [Sulfitobacter sp.]